jgi:hypothetical protein
MKLLLCSNTTVNDVTQVSGIINIYKIITMNKQYEFVLRRTQSAFVSMNTVKLLHNAPHSTRIRKHRGSNNVSQNDCILVLKKIFRHLFPISFLSKNFIEKTLSCLLPRVGNMTLQVMVDLLRRCQMFLCMSDARTFHWNQFGTLGAPCPG